MIPIDHIVGPENPKHFLQLHRRSIVIDFLIATSTHGLRSVGRAYSKANRIFWVITFMLALGIMLYFVISAILQYYAYPTQTKVEIRLDRSMTFPAVTVCSGNSYRYDKINASLVAYFNRITPPNTTYDQAILNSLVIPLVVDLFRRNQTEELVSIGFQISDYLLSCTYNEINCSNAFIPSISSSMGNCFTFNWKKSSNLFTISDMGQNVVFREGLYMTFYVPQELFFPISWFDVGLIVLLHENDELPTPDENGLYLQPRQSHLITYQKSETTFLPAPYTNCSSTVSDDLRNLYKTTFLDPDAATEVAYSESLCFELCEQAYINYQCSCILPIPFFARYVFTVDNQLIAANFCSVFNNDIPCAIKAKQQLAISSSLQNLWCSRCAPQCSHTYFKSDISAQEGPSEGEKEYWYNQLIVQNNTGTVLLPNDFSQKFDYYFSRNYLRVRIACGSKYVTEYKQEAKLTMIDTFSAIGGQTGLWIGLSVLSVIEMSELVYRLIRHHFKQSTNRKRVTVISTINTKIEAFN